MRRKISFMSQFGGYSIVMVPGQEFLLFGSGQPSLVWAWHLKISLYNPKFSIFSPLVQKKSHQVGSKSTRVGLLFTAGQKYARVGSG